MKKVIGVLIAITMCIVTFCIPVSAVTVFYLSDAAAGNALEAADEAAIESIDLTYRSGSTGDSGNGSDYTCLFMVYEGEGSEEAFYFNRAFYTDLSKKDKKKVIKTFTEELKNAPQIKSADMQIIHNALKEVDDKYITSAIADLLNSSQEGMLSAVVLLKPLTGPIGTLLGIVAILMVLFMVLTTVIDFVYIGLPFADKTGGEKPKFMSRDAYKALQENTNGSTSNVYWGYLKKRFLTYLITIICILYLVSGGFGDLFLTISDTFGGLFS